jgi:hypothetical protein
VLSDYIDILSKKSGGKLINIIDQGLENQKWITKQRERGDKVSLAVTVCVIGSMVTGTLTALGYAFITFVKGQ